MKTAGQLQADGFTTSGIYRYQQTVTEYAEILHAKAVSYGDAAKAPSLAREVTHDHVRAAAHLIADSVGKPKTSGWFAVSHVAEYALTAISAFSLGNTKAIWSTPVFVISAVIAGILIVVRISKVR